MKLLLLKQCLTMEWATAILFMLLAVRHEESG